MLAALESLPMLTAFLHSPAKQGMSTATHEPVAEKLHRVWEARGRAMRMVRSAADARRDVSADFLVRLAEMKVEILGLGSVGRDVLAVLDTLRSQPDSVSEREAKLVVLLDATVANLVVTNEAFAEMAATVTRQLVGEPGKLISGSEIAEMLGVTEEAARLRHKDGKLLAILSAGRERGRGFPIFQAWDGVAGQPLEQILQTLGYEGPGKGSIDAAEAFQFFISRNELLGDFTPVEVLTGAGLPRDDDAQASDFLAKPHAERLEFVKAVAKTVREAHGQ
jgi:hypothetical protein